MAGADFNVYRDGQRIATVTDSTNYLDPAGTATSRYRVASVVRGREGDRGPSVTPWADGYYSLPLRKPADGVTPTGEAYTYSANDMSVGDLDGDGQYEYVVKWDPSNSKDVSQVGYTGPVYLDAYELDGRHLYRIDLGVNIRAGAHYTQFLTYDFDRDGRAETMLKTAPGTKVIRYNADGTVRSERYITMPREDVRAGYAHTDDYRLSAADYHEHLVQMFMAWPQHPEVVAGRWPATLEAAFGIAPTYQYPLSRADAVALVDYFIDVYAPSRSTRNLLRNFQGFIVDGPEYLTVFEGATGRELQTIRYKPGRDRRRPDVGRLRAGPDRAGQPGRPVPGRRGVPGRQAAIRDLRARLLHPDHPDRLRLGRPAAARAVVRRQRLGADDEPVQRRAARPRRHGPAVRHDHHAGRPLAQRGRRGRRREAGDHLRRGHPGRRRQPAVLLVRRAARGQRRARARTSGSATATRCT